MRRIFAAIILALLLSFGALHAQTIRGTVTDKASGRPLEYATVSIRATNPPLGATTDSLGRFSISNIPVGRYDIQASFVGYESVIIKEVLLSVAKETALEVQLQERSQELGGVEVRPQVDKARPLNSMALSSARMFSVEEASRYAGGFDDPARLATAFAGVTSGLQSNGIVVRGNAPRFLQWRLEDVEIPNPNHFAETASFGGGGVTAVSSLLLGNSDFFTGAFPAEYSNALSGVFDINLRNGNNRKRESAFQLGAIGIDFASEGPIGKGGEASYIFNYRYSTLAFMSAIAPKVLPEQASLIKYQDLSFKMNFPTRIGTFSLWGIWLDDYSGQKAKLDSAQWTYMNDKEQTSVDQFMGAFGISHRIRTSSRSFLKTSLATTISGLDFAADRLNPHLSLEPQSHIVNTNQNFVFASSLNTKFSARHTNKTGIRLTGLSYNLRLQNSVPEQSGAAGEALTTIVDESGFSALLSAYSQSALELTSALTLNLGLSAQLFSLNSRYAIEPRAGLRWRFAADHSAGLSYGLHSRLEMLHYYFIRSAAGELQNRKLDFTRAHHLVLSYDWNISPDYHLRIEPYVQHLYSVPVIAGTSFSSINLQNEWFITQPLENSGRGRNLGIDFTFEKYMSRGYYAMLTASLFDSRYSGGDGIWRNTRYNRNYVLNLLAGREWLLGKRRRNILNAGIRLTYEGGDRHTPINLPASQAATEPVYLESQAFSQSYAPIFLSHISISYKINRTKLAHEIALKILNASMYKEYQGDQYNFRTQQVDAMRDPVIVPNISYKIEF
ncbi:MAG: TonB-dependent receptor [Tannerellaceae bacterium]|jgi:hypothetical protein|nr:TonB-dependent receptor [Tannerellaceae bacterium]